MSSDLRMLKLGFLNCGEIARSLIFPLIRQNLVNPKYIYVADTTEDVSITWGNIANPLVNIYVHPTHVAGACDIIFVGFNPRTLTNDLNIAILPSLPKVHVFKQKLIVSLIPGLKCVELAKKIAEYGIPRVNVQLMRVMPNKAMTIGEGLILYCLDEYVSKTLTLPVIELLSYHNGMVEEIDESLMDIAAYGPAMCGPAYVYLLMEAMADGAVKNDLPRDLAIKFVAQVFAGAAKMVLKSGKHPGQLKDESCVPEGPAINGIYELEVGRVRAALINAADAAAKKLMERKLEK